MKLAIISTTIRGEKGYLPYDRLAQNSKFSEVRFFVTGDMKSPPFDTRGFQCGVEYLTAEEQKKYHSSEPIGWNKYARRNIALLRAMETKPDFILMVDDDNIPAPDYFDAWHAVLTKPAEKVAVSPEGGAADPWHNYLKATDAPFEMFPRGFPIPFRHRDSVSVAAAKDPIANEKIGLFQGVSLGDPDIDAKTRIVYPKETPLTVLKEKNYCLRGVWSPFNTQNTVFAKALFPLAFTWPGAERFEDIYASFAWQQFLFNNGMYTHIGDAVNRQERGKRDHLVDFRREIEGYLSAHEVWEAVRKISEKDPVRFIEQLIASPHPIIAREREFFRAFLRDLDRLSADVKIIG